ncbi:hypothetical protein [Streptomyces roseolus]|uniref:hypothetical protein n=1 Tax=Streptomyces roseolus TaxID=67358 RepID=UPI0016728FD2|nr:hypothetical protein [Streptomyces roseolus]
MALPTAGMSFRRPTGYVMPMIRASMVETPREGRPRGQAPEIAVLSDCHQQFQHEGLQRLVMDLACTAGEATVMFSEHSSLSPMELLQQFSAHHAVSMATDQTAKGGDVVWGYIPAIVRPIFEPGARPGMDEVLFEIDEKYGFHTSMDFIVALAIYSGAVVRRLAKATDRDPEEIMQELEQRAEPIWRDLDAFDTRAYMTT